MTKLMKNKDRISPIDIGNRIYIDHNGNQKVLSYPIKNREVSKKKFSNNIKALRESYVQGCEVCGSMEHWCCLCDFCATHGNHSGEGHDYDFDSCWQCEDN